MTSASGSWSPDDVHALTAAYALDAVDDDERRAYEDHLADCDDCRADLVSMSETAALLGSVVEVTPPAGMRDAVLARVRVTPQVVTPSSRPTAEAPEPSTAEPPAPVTTAPPVVAAPPRDDLATRRMSRTRRATVALGSLAAAFALVAAGLGAWGLSLRRDLDRTSDLAAAVSSVITAPDAVSVDGQATGGGRVAVVTSPTAGSVLVVDGLPPLPSGKVYQSWFVTAGGTPTSAGVVPVSANGIGGLVLPAAPPGTAAVAVSVEPSIGSTAPSTTPIVIVRT